MLPERIWAAAGGLAPDASGTLLCQMTGYQDSLGNSSCCIFDAVGLLYGGRSCIVKRPKSYSSIPDFWCVLRPTVAIRRWVFFLGRRAPWRIAWPEGAPMKLR